MSAWNAGFELLAFRSALGPRFGWPVPNATQMDDTAAAAAAMALPRGLDEAASAIGLEIGKDADGYRVMLQMAKPRKPRKDEAPGQLYWHDDAERFQKLLAYNRTDVAVERSMRNKLMRLSDRERAIFRLDQKINERGVAIDLKLVDRMRSIVVAETHRLDVALREATGGAIKTINHVTALIRWLTANGAITETLAKARVTEMLEEGRLPDLARRVLEIRREAAKASTSKLKAARRCVCRDGRARGLLLYHGANTGRWAGKLLQPQNMPRPSGLVKDPEIAIPWLMSGSAAAVDFAYGWPLRAVADSLRAIIVARDDHELLSADFASIESRVLAWIAGEAWKIEAYHAFDNGRGFGMYELVAAAIFSQPVEEIGKEDPRRQVGKTAELALGFASGVTGLTAMARNYNVRMADALPALLKSAPYIRLEAAERRYRDCLRRSDASADVLSKKSWMASELTKLAWRATNPATSTFWKTISAAATAAVEQPGVQIDIPRISFRTAYGFLWMRLPSGRCLAYPAPRISLVDPPWADNTLPASEREKVRAVTALTPLGKKLVRYPLYGGLLTENAVQATARDLLADAMLRVEAAGYPIVLTVHDENSLRSPGRCR